MIRWSQLVDSDHTPVVRGKSNLRFTPFAPLITWQQELRLVTLSFECRNNNLIG